MRIDADNLACRRSGRLVFEGLSFTLSDGAALIVTGRNGAGKSSLLGILAGRLAPVAGALSIAGAGERTLPECLHFVGHRDALKGALTAEENLAFARDLLGDAALAPRAALAAVGLEHAAALPVAYLSAGQRRRVALARLLVAHRPVWLLDEPTAALDAAAREMLLGLMRAHLSTGGLLIAATHQPLKLEGATELRMAAADPSPRGAASAASQRGEGLAPAAQGEPRITSGVKSAGGGGACPGALHPETSPHPDGSRRLGLSPHAGRGEGESA